MTSLELLQEIDAWLCFNIEPSKEEITQLRKSIKEHIVKQLNIRPFDAIFDTHQNRVYKLSECDKEMLDVFPTRYLHVLLSDKLKEGNDR